jgi:GNAT superfamily N-acetyltransferase
MDNIKIRPARSDDDLQQVRALYQGFAKWLSQTYSDILPFLKWLFDGLEADAAALPGECAEPSGCILLAWMDGQAVGTVGLKPCGAGAAEMVHMFVSPLAQGNGLGRMLAERLISEARERGYTQLRLETGPRQIAAQKLYLSLGFKPQPAFHASPVPEEMLQQLPADIRQGTLYMVMAL